MYESKISNAKWIAYDLPGNVGWIMFLVGLVLCFTKKPEITGDKVILVFLLLDLLCAAAMIIGIAQRPGGLWSPPVYVLFGRAVW